VLTLQLSYDDDDALELPLQPSYDDDALELPLQQPSYDDDALELPLQLSYDALQPRSVPFRMVRSVTEPVAGKSCHLLAKVSTIWSKYVGCVSEFFFLKNRVLGDFFCYFYPLFTRKYCDFREFKKKRLLPPSY